ncbi:MAG: helix-turn-helix domain-containing protein [Clostridium sp.]
MRAYKVKAAAAMLDADHQTVKREIERGRLRAFKVGYEWRISEEALAEYMNLIKNNFKTEYEVQLEEENKKLKAKIQAMTTAIERFREDLTMAIF